MDEHWIAEKYACFSDIPAAVSVVDGRTREIIYANSPFEKKIGRALAAPGFYGFLSEGGGAARVAGLSAEDEYIFVEYSYFKDNNRAYYVCVHVPGEDVSRAKAGSGHTPGDPVSLVNRMAAKAASEKTVFSMCYLNLYCYDAISAGQGREAAAEAVGAVRELLKNSIRSTDLIEMINHKEFLLIFPKCGYGAAESIITSTLKRIELFNETSGRGYELGVKLGLEEYDGAAGGAAEAAFRAAQSAALN